MLEYREHQVELRALLVLFAEVVDVVDFLVQVDPVRFLVEPVAAQQVVAEDGGILVGALVFLEFQERVDEVEQVGVGRNFLRVFEHLHEALARIAVAVGKSLERHLETVGELVARGEDVLVDGVVGIDVGGLPAVADPLVARFGQFLERVLVGAPAVGAEVPAFELGSAFVEVLADERNHLGEGGEVDAGGEEAFFLEEFYERLDDLEFLERVLDGGLDFGLLGVGQGFCLDVLEELAGRDSSLVEVEVADFDQ